MSAVDITYQSNNDLIVDPDVAVKDAEARFNSKVTWPLIALATIALVGAAFLIPFYGFSAGIVISSIIAGAVLALTITGIYLILFKCCCSSADDDEIEEDVGDTRDNNNPTNITTQGQQQANNDVSSNPNKPQLEVEYITIDSEITKIKSAIKYLNDKDNGQIEEEDQVDELEELSS